MNYDSIDVDSDPPGGRDENSRLEDITLGTVSGIAMTIGFVGMLVLAVGNAGIQYTYKKYHGALGHTVERVDSEDSLFFRYRVKR